MKLFLTRTSVSLLTKRYLYVLDLNYGFYRWAVHRG